MSDIELVIKIPEEDFERCKKRFQMRTDIMGDAIANGIPLDKIRVEIEQLPTTKCTETRRIFDSISPL